MTDEQKPVDQPPAPTPPPRALRRRSLRDHSTYEPAPGNFRPVWGLLLFLAGIVALVALAAAVVDTLVLN